MPALVKQYICWIIIVPWIICGGFVICLALQVSFVCWVCVCLPYPAIPANNSYQINLTIAGNYVVLDAAGIYQSVCKGQLINDRSTNEAKYCLVCALNDYPAHEEMETSYERKYWRREIKRDKLSDEDKVKASEIYNINPEYLV